MTTKGDDTTIQRRIDEVLLRRSPHTVGELAAYVEAENPKLSTNLILAEIRRMANSGQFVLAPKSFQSFSNYWVDLQWNSSFWIIMLLSIGAFLTVIVQLFFPWTLIRLAIMLPLLFYLPGHNVLRITVSHVVMTLLERILLEFSLSVVIIMLLGLVLNFSLLGFYATTTIGIVVLFNLVTGFLASYRNYVAFHNLST